jgi:hypothetical protein
MIMAKAQATLGLLACVIAMPVAAQTAGPTPTAPVIIQTIVTPPTAATDPDRLAKATRIAAALLPVGTYRKMMSGTMDQMMKGAVDQALDMPMRDMARAANLSPEQLAKVGPGTARQIAAIMDPAFRQRMDLGLKAMMGIMVDMMAKYEPSARDGLAEAYGARFTSAQLDDLERFFATPTGNAYAAQSMLVYTDPAVISRMQAMIPAMMKQMPDMLGAMAKATAGLPPPRKYAQLTKAERAEVARLLGVDPKTLR